MVRTFGKEVDPGKRIRKAQGKDIRELRKLKGLSIQEFAEAVGVTEGAVSQWELGGYSPRPHHQVRIAAIFDVTWSSLFGLDRVA